MRIFLFPTGRKVHLTKLFSMYSEVFGGDMDGLSPVRPFLKGFFKLPPVNDKSFWKELLSICMREKINYLIPLRDEDLPSFAEKKEIFEEKGIKVIVQDLQVLQMVFDRLDFYKKFHQKLPLPKTYSIDEVKEDLLPLFFKPRMGYAREPKGVLKKTDDLMQLSEKNLIFQEVLEGREFSIDVLSHNSAIKAIAARERISVRDSQVDKGRTVDPVPFLDLIQKILEYIPLNWVFNVQVKGGKILEINPRFPGGIYIDFLSGVDMVGLFIKILEGIDFTPVLGGKELYFAGYREYVLL